VLISCSTSVLSTEYLSNIENKYDEDEYRIRKEQYYDW